MCAQLMPKTVLKKSTLNGSAWIIKKIKKNRKMFFSFSAPLCCEWLCLLFFYSLLSFNKDLADAGGRIELP
jgi:hypothetical protein